MKLKVVRIYALGKDACAWVTAPSVGCGGGQMLRWRGAIMGCLRATVGIIFMLISILAWIWGLIELCLWGFKGTGFLLPHLPDGSWVWLLLFNIISAIWVNAISDKPDKPDKPVNPYLIGRFAWACQLCGSEDHSTEYHAGR
ncbi:hypothetical protein [Nonomuraea sp. NPDC049129]|uniref:hypothetical protein n=1 Tax=Nonomuraea sp. NPDC049129 TaxID=3155272 RepID=UPI0033EF82EB